MLKLRNRGWVIAAAVGAALTGSGNAQASVKVFQSGEEPGIINDNLKSQSAAASSFNRGTAAKAVLDFMSRNKEAFGLEKADGETLELRKVHQDEQGASLRYVQRFNRVRIDGAEIVANFDNLGNLKAVTSSLVPTPLKISVQPSVTRAQALAKALTLLSGIEPAMPAESLVIAKTPNGDRALVWKFDLWGTEGARQIMIHAQGARAGELFRSINASTDADNTAQRIMYDARFVPALPNPFIPGGKGVRTLVNGKKTFQGSLLGNISEAEKAEASFVKTLTYYAESIGRNSWDGKGAKVEASVNVKLADVLGMKQNAAWMGPWNMFVFGAGGELLTNFTGSLDVVAHEFTHAVIQTTSNLEYVSQSGGLNEHLADVFGEMVQEAVEHPAQKLLIGEVAMTEKAKTEFHAEALRDMVNPEKGLSPQPRDMGEIKTKFPEYDESCQPAEGNDNCGVHTLSGIPNRAVALMVQSLGWNAIRPLIYRVMTARLISTSNFADYRAATMDECLELNMPVASCAKVADAFKAVGL